MDQWIFVAAIIIGGIMLTTLISTIVGSLVRYVLFVGLSAVIYRWQNGVEDFEFIMDLEILQDLAVIGLISFIITMSAMMLGLAKNRFRFLLYPAVGFVVTFATSAVWQTTPFAGP